MTEFKPGDRVRVCDGSADHWRTGVIDSIYAYSDVSNHLVLLDGEDECCGYSAHDLELIKSKFKVGDRVAPYNQPNSPGTITAPDPHTPGRWMVKFDGYDVSSSAEFTLVHYKPTTHTRGTHPNSLANLAPGQERREGEWEEKRLRLSAGACDWLREQGRGNMSRAVERLIMEKISKEEGEGS
jgi:hypothetical protein